MSKGQFFPYGDINKSSTFPILTILIIIANAVIFFLTLTNSEYIATRYGFIPAQISLLTIFTSMFLHGGFDHLFGNMWYLWVFGDNVEDKFGKLGFLILYFTSGIAASIMHFITNVGSTVPAIGASGAISGILGSYLALFSKAGVNVSMGYTITQMPAFVVIGGWFALQLIFGAVSFVGGTGSGIAFFAHIGGFVFGYVITKLLKIK